MIKNVVYTLVLLLASCHLACATLTPARNITTSPNTFSKCIPSSVNDVQTALNDLDSCSGGGGGGTPGSPLNSFQYNNSGVFAGGNMYQANNNVGIGSTLPGATLDVNGGIRTQGFALTSGSSLLGKILTSDASGNGTWQNNSAGGGGVNPGTAGDFPYYASNGSVVSDQSILTLAGSNVGIGVPVPLYNLHVNGSIGASAYYGPGIITGLSAGLLPVATGGNTLANSVITNVGNNVGIDSISPGQALDVQGTVRSFGSVIGSLSGILKGASGVVGTATSGTDYAPATSGTSILKGNGTGGFSNAAAGTDYQTPLSFSTGLTNSAGTVVVNNSQNIAQLSNLTSNGIVTTSGGAGNLSITPFNGTLGLWEKNNVGIDTFNPVGIGSTNPGQALDVTGIVRSQGFQGDSAGTMEVASNQGIGLDSVNGTYTTPTLLLSTGGNAGVGSSNPGQKLDVQGTVRMAGVVLTTGASSGYILTSNGVGVGTWQPAPASGGTPGGSTSQLQYNNAGSFGGIAGSGTTGGNVGIGSVNPEFGLVVGANGAKFVNATPTSTDSFFTTSVGIGTTAPGGRLDVEGTIRSIVFNALPGTLNVGIGSFLPGQKLDVKGTIRTTGFNLNSGITNGYVLTTDSSGNGTWAASTGTSQWNGTNPIYYLNNVGIGSTIPGQILDVKGTVRATNFSGSGALITGVPVSTGISGLGTGVATFLATPSSANLAGAITDEVGTGFSVFNGGPNFTGNVGVGSTNAGQALDVQGTIRMTGFQLGTSTTNGYVLTANGTTGVGVYAPATGGGSGTVNSGTAGQAAYYATSTTAVSSNPNLVFNGSNVGIGSTAPGQILDVQGTVRGNQFTATGIAPSSFSSNVGISSTTPGALLDVQGSVRILGGNGLNIGTTAANLNYLNVGTTNQFNVSSTGVVNSGTINSTGSFLTSSANGTMGGNASSSNSQTAFAGGASATSNLLLRSTTGNGTADSIQLQVGTNGNNKVLSIQDNSGIANVGIGSVNPGDTLDVQGTTRITNVGIALDVEGTLSEATFAGNVGIGTTFGNAALAVMNGNVGIGTWNPQDYFSVGNSNNFHSSSSGAVVAASIRSTSFIGSTSASGNMSLQSNNTSGTTDFIKLSVNNNATEVMRIQDNSGVGNVGIGSTAPGQALDVTGTVRSSLGFVAGSNCFYYCNGGTDVGLLSRGSGCLCPGGSCVATNICSN